MPTWGVNKTQPTLPTLCFPLEKRHFFLICTEAYGLTIALLIVISYPCPPPHWAPSTLLLVIIPPLLHTWAPGYNHIHCLLPTIILRTSIYIERELIQQLGLSISWCLWPQQSCSSLHFSYPLNSYTIDPVITRNFYFEILFFDLHFPLLQLTCCSGAPTSTFLVPFNDH